MAGTLEASWFVVADLAAAPILLATLIDIWTGRKGEGLLPGHVPAGLTVNRTVDRVRTRET